MSSSHSDNSSFTNSSVLGALSPIGWDAILDEQFTGHAAQGLLPGRVSRVDRGRCDVHTTLGVLHATIPATGLELPESGVVTGDWVAIEFGASATVRAVLPRGTALYRA
ncbi:MAG: ribosome small subunit-dependent GTPase A, partial [Gordonia amarae]